MNVAYISRSTYTSYLDSEEAASTGGFDNAKVEKSARPGLSEQGGARPVTASGKRPGWVRRAVFTLLLPRTLSLLSRNKGLSAVEWEMWHLCSHDER